MHTIKQLSIKAKSFHTRLRYLVDEDSKWVTINGTHILLKDGEDPMVGLKRVTDGATAHDKKTAPTEPVTVRKAEPGVEHKIPRLSLEKNGKRLDFDLHGKLSDSVSNRFPKAKVDISGGIVSVRLNTPSAGEAAVGASSIGGLLKRGVGSKKLNYLDDRSERGVGGKIISRVIRWRIS